MSWEGFYYGTLNEWMVKATANASGVAAGTLGPCPEGFCWYVERYTTKTNSSGNPVCEIYALNTDIDQGNIPLLDVAGRQDYTAVGKNDVSDNVQPVYIRAGQYLVAVWTGCASGDACQLSGQIRVHQIPPVTATPYDLAQLTEGPLVEVGDPGGDVGLE